MLVFCQLLINARMICRYWLDFTVIRGDVRWLSFSSFAIYLAGKYAPEGREYYYLFEILWHPPEYNIVLMCLGYDMCLVPFANCIAAVRHKDSIPLCTLTVQTPVAESRPSIEGMSIERKICGNQSKTRTWSHEDLEHWH